MSKSRGQRGPYAKGIAKRAEILDVAVEVIASEGYSGATVKRLADAVGLSQNGLLRYFGSKDALFIEVLRRHEELVELEVDPEHADFAADLTVRLVDAVTANITFPGMSQLTLSVTAAALDEHHEGHAYISSRYETFRQITADTLREMQGRGTFPSTGDPDTAASVIVAAFDGIQAQWLFDSSIDVPGAMTYLLQALGLGGNPPK